MQNNAQHHCVFRLVELGLVVIEHSNRRNEFTIVRPASVIGAAFHGWADAVTLGVGSATLSINAPPATLQECRKGWLVDISVPAAPGPGPVWFHSRFTTVDEAVEATEACYFGSLVDNQNASLNLWFGTPGS